MRIQFLADADLKFQIVVAVRQLEPTIDFMSADEAGLAGSKDPQVLLHATRQGRMLVTHDRQTMRTADALGSYFVRRFSKAPRHRHVEPSAFFTAAHLNSRG